MSRSSRINRSRRERSKTNTSFDRGNSEEGKSNAASRDARTFLQSKRQRTSESVQSLVDKRWEEQRRTKLTGSSHPANPAIAPQEFSRGGPLEAPMLINSPLFAEV